MSDPVDERELGDVFARGGRATLEVFRDELRLARDEIEHAGEPVFDIILQLLDQSIARIDRFRAPGISEAELMGEQ